MIDSPVFMRFWISSTTCALALWYAESRVQVGYDTHVLALWLIAATAFVTTMRVPVYSYRFYVLGFLSQLFVFAAPYAAIFEASRQGYLPSLQALPNGSSVILGVSIALTGLFGHLTSYKRYRRDRRVFAIRRENQTIADAKLTYRVHPLEDTRSMDELVFASKP